MDPRRVSGRAGLCPCSLNRRRRNQTGIFFRVVWHRRHHARSFFRTFWAIPSALRAEGRFSSGVALRAPSFASLRTSTRCAGLALRRPYRTLASLARPPLQPPAIPPDFSGMLASLAGNPAPNHPLSQPTPPVSRFPEGPPNPSVFRGPSTTEFLQRRGRLIRNVLSGHARVAINGSVPETRRAGPRCSRPRLDRPDPEHGCGSRVITVSFFRHRIRSFDRPKSAEHAGDWAWENAERVGSTAKEPTVRSRCARRPTTACARVGRRRLPFGAVHHGISSARDRRPGRGRPFFRHHVRILDDPEWARPSGAGARENAERVAGENGLELDFIPRKGYCAGQRVRQIRVSRGKHSGLVHIVSAMEPRRSRAGAQRSGAAPHRLGHGAARKQGWGSNIRSWSTCSRPWSRARPSSRGITGAPAGMAQSSGACASRAWSGRSGSRTGTTCPRSADG